MKAIVTHPLAIMISFMFVIISGKSFGGFYIIYLVMGLPDVYIHCVLGVLGILLLVPGFFLQKEKRSNLRQILNILGSSLMLLSLVMFFYNDKKLYNIATFYQIVPLTTLLIFVLLTISFIAANTVALLKRRLANKY